MRIHSVWLMDSRKNFHLKAKGEKITWATVMTWLLFVINSHPSLLVTFIIRAWVSRRGQHLTLKFSSLPLPSPPLPQTGAAAASQWQPWKRVPSRACSLGAKPAAGLLTRIIPGAALCRCCSRMFSHPQLGIPPVDISYLTRRNESIWLWIKNFKKHTATEFLYKIAMGGLSLTPSFWFVLWPIKFYVVQYQEKFNSTKSDAHNVYQRL